MGANGSYDKELDGVSKDNRTHIETGFKIQGHKVLLQEKNKEQKKNIMYSNSESPTYLMAKLNSNGTITIHDINIFENHKLKLEINLVFDRNGNIVPYNPKKPDLGSHAHHWTEKKEGVMGRDNKPDVNPHM